MCWDESGSFNSISFTNDAEKGVEIRFQPWGGKKKDNDFVMENTYGDLKVDGLVSNLSVNHGGFQERPEEEKLLDLASSRLWNRQTGVGKCDPDLYSLLNTDKKRNKKDKILKPSSFD